MQHAAANRAASAAAPGLQERIQGSVHTPGEPAYEEACRIWNAMIERRPILVVRPAGPQDVAETIRFAKENGLPLAVPGRWPQRRRRGARRSGHHHRHEPEAPRQRRSGPLGRARGAGRDLEGRRCGDAAARPCRAERHHLSDGRGRLHARRWLRLDFEEARLCGRQSRRCGGRHCRRKDTSSEQCGGAGPFLGAAGRQRQFRGGHGISSSARIGMGRRLRPGLSSIPSNAPAT